MEVDVDVGVFIEGAYAEKSVGPKKHDCDEGQPVEAEVEGVKADIVGELGLDLVIVVEKFADKVAVDGAEDAENSCEEAVELGLVYADAVFEVVDDKDEDGGAEADGVDDGQGQVELRSRDGQSMQHHDPVAFDQIAEVDVVLIVESHAVVACDQEVECHRGHSPQQGCLNRADVELIRVEEGQWEDDLH